MTNLAESIKTDEDHGHPAYAMIVVQEVGDPGCDGQYTGIQLADILQQGQVLTLRTVERQNMVMIIYGSIFVKHCFLFLPAYGKHIQ